jgi:two-component system response regulator AtoC
MASQMPPGKRESTTTEERPDLEPLDDERRVVLIVTHRGEATVVPLEPGRSVVIGRSPTNEQGPTLRLDDARVSRSHARWSLAPGGGGVVEDLGSRNGTWVEGKRVVRAEITASDEVRVGGALVTLRTLGGRTVLSDEPPGDGELIASETMRVLLEKVHRLASTRVSVVVQGETGTGKEMIAELLHRRGHRRDKPLLKVNCAAVPANLVEATFFGHKRGAFTGATGQRGIFEEADGGTVLLDEVVDLPLAAQGALLRVLDKNSFSRVGSVAEISVDVRVVAATHRDLDALVASGQFRADLYHRLSAVTLKLPPLRERRADVAPLAQLFLQAANKVNGRRVRGFEAEALRVLEAYSWPGNVRELKHAVERAVVLTAHERLRPDDFPRQQLASVTRREGGAPGHGAESGQAPPSTERVSAVDRPDLAHDKDDTPPAPRSDTWPPGEGRPEALPDRLRTLEATMIRDALQAVGWNRADAAARLGIPLRTLARKIIALGIQKPRNV